MKKGILASILLVLVTAGCAVNHYHAKDYQGNGYSEYRMATDRFIVTYIGDHSTDPEDVQRYVLRRAAEVASNYGYRYFIVEGERDLTKSTLVKSKREKKSFIEDFWSDQVEPVTKTYERISEYRNHAIELSIKCFASRPKQEESIDAYQFLAYNSTSNVS
ncbi:MAG: hypothetical protein KFB93_06170 [Simkaniaceae bacterium]|nr:MAG: hypothetical protein KFB93_06170 [Simkaniaceae bacterium]